MRHTLMARFVFVVAAVSVVTAVLFAVIANIRVPAEAMHRTDVILNLETDIGNGIALYNEITQPSCATCHALALAGAEADRALSLDTLRPSARVTIDSLVGGTVRAHDARGYEHNLTNQQIADLAAYIEQAAGN